MSRVVRASDDRARRMVTRTTRKDKLDEEKREMREEEEERDEQSERNRGGESRSGTNGRVCVQINE